VMPSTNGKIMGIGSRATDVRVKRTEKECLQTLVLVSRCFLSRFPL
jgi:hypothetical protein